MYDKTVAGIIVAISLPLAGFAFGFAIYLIIIH